MRIDLKLLAAEIGGTFAVLALVLFLAAGTIVWLAGGVFLGLLFAFTVALSWWLLRHNPGLLLERMTGIGRPEQKAWDKVFYMIASVLFLAWLALMALDAARFRWSWMPLWLRAAGALVLLSSFYLFFLIFRENPYLSPAVRLQADRGQTVVSTGPYRHVRHPMYGAVIIFMLGTTLLLGSWYGLLLVLVFVFGLGLRAVHEERLLRAELPGYAEYMTRVKYRLIPYIW